jgi:hypothetical protein
VATFAFQCFCEAVALRAASANNADAEMTNIDRRHVAANPWKYLKFPRSLAKRAGRKAAAARKVARDRQTIPVVWVMGNVFLFAEPAPHPKRSLAFLAQGQRDGRQITVTISHKFDYTVMNKL